MNTLRRTLLSLITVALVLGAGSAAAQDYTYDVGYFTNANASGAPSAHLRLTNDGDNSAASLCANLYVFDNQEEMAECCGCQVTANGYLDLTVNSNLVGNMLDHGTRPTRGIVKVVSSLVPANGTCNPMSETPADGIKGWLTHVQKTSSSGAFSITETPLTDSNLSQLELSFNLEETCFFVQWLGFPTGVCSCTDAGD
ncbi:MAG TPA: hypothetical protein VK706_18085 [Candidatus Sulfotelmatobacter sp.]|jgi:hypothetical protein|nr:hypothetical protein [Candidatus Sulfotelmatobacter sp.]